MSYNLHRRAQNGGRQREINTSTPSRWGIPVGVIAIILLSLVGVGYLLPPTWNATVGRVEALRMPEGAFRLGLDLQGGAHLVYEADVSAIPSGDRSQSMQGVRDVIERRVNALGVSEPIVQTSETGDTYRVIVELAGVTDINKAIQEIGETPILEFMTPRAASDDEESVVEVDGARIKTDAEGNISIEGLGDGNEPLALDYSKVIEAQRRAAWTNSELGGAHLKRAAVEFDPNTGVPYVSLQFNEEGGALFAQMTEQYQGQQIAIFLDGQAISAPVVQQKIVGGEAIITGLDDIEEARTLAQRLNAGALPVPIELVSQQTVGPTLGAESLEKSLVAGAIGIALVALLMLLYYRLPGLLAVGALIIYGILLLVVTKALSVTLTLPGIAGVILSIGMAVDANILIFERLKEELRGGRSLDRAIDEGVARAWLSIRDGNMTALFTCVILYAFSSSFIQGFALTLGLGILSSMFTAIIVTRWFMKLVARVRWVNRPFLYSVSELRQ
ncbi:MAG: protein translocase subunit SecD, partial [Patescibacteria group bacterium]